MVFIFLAYFTLYSGLQFLEMELLGQKIRAFKVLKRLSPIKAKPVHAHQQGKRISVSSNSF